MFFTPRTIMPSDTKIQTSDDTQVPMWVLCWEGWLSMVRKRAPQGVYARVEKSLMNFFNGWDGRSVASKTCLGLLNQVTAHQDVVERYCPEAFPDPRRVSYRRKQIAWNNAKQVQQTMLNNLEEF
tara:strand:+ start:3512 stop:3886 length:375 start_codon:yes stop_codon:yes gene_type:complete